MSATRPSSSPGAGSTWSISVSANFQPVRLLGHLAGPFGAVHPVAARHQPFVAQFAVALQGGLGPGEAVQRGALFLRAHQPQLVVLPVQCQQPVGQAGQRLP